MPKENASKASDYVKSKIKVTRTASVVHKVPVSKDKVCVVQNIMSDTGKHYVIVDGGADTGLKGGKTSRFLEHTLQKVSITGFDDEMVQENLPIGTRATKVTDIKGN